VQGEILGLAAAGYVLAAALIGGATAGPRGMMTGAVGAAIGSVGGVLL
jgi:hypothetical protein